MAERVKDDHHLQRVLPPSNSGGESKHVDSQSGDVLRIDSAHIPPAEIAMRGVEWQEFEHFAPSQPAAIPASSSSSESTHSDSSLLDEFTQHFRRRDAQLQAQKAGLIQREQALLAQQMALENDHKQITHQLTIEHAELDAKKDPASRKTPSRPLRSGRSNSWKSSRTNSMRTFKHSSSIERNWTGKRIPSEKI